MTIISIGTFLLDRSVGREDIKRQRVFSSDKDKVSPGPSTITYNFPYFEFMIDMASSMSLTVIIDKIGPNVSSAMSESSMVIFWTIVGAIYFCASSVSPPTIILPLLPLSIDFTRLKCASVPMRPKEVDLSPPSGKNDL